jgi:hypothetical protein
LLGDGATWAEGRFWGLEDSSETFATNSAKTPFIGQPIFDVTQGRFLNSPLTAANFARGNISILSKNDLIGADAWLRRTFFDDGRRQFGILGGYQFTRLDDSLTQSFAGTAIAGNPQPAGTTLTSFDSFRTQNEFHGGSIGFAGLWRRNVWTVEVLAKVGLGNMHERIVIDGRQTLTQPGNPPSSVNHGSLTLASNIGDRTANHFAAVPELNVNGVYNISPAWRILAGYSILYWSDAVLAGDQIDNHLNFNQPATRPAFKFQRSDFVVQGLNMGAEYRW